MTLVLLMSVMCRVQLSGVEEPFWSDLPYTDICKVICNDVLHGLHKASSDHPADWSIKKIGDIEIDNCFPQLPKTPGYRHFSGGISKISQWSGRDDIGAQSAGAIIATCAELDVIYHAQWWTLSETDIQWMVDFNQKFHAHKDAFLNGGGRDQNHFEIPKLHARHHYPENIRWLGVPFNYTNEISECYHIEVAKKAHKDTNCKNYITQMITWLECQEKLHFHSQYVWWMEGDWKISGDNSPDFLLEIDVKN
ncbi:hypothetical protein K439DRAFT_1647782 [Ramaria rubella]|nr:hypothetical protein K439DRAFT_1647782 [Ramaria rubella]